MLMGEVRHSALNRYEPVLVTLTKAAGGVFSLGSLNCVLVARLILILFIKCHKHNVLSHL